MPSARGVKLTPLFQRYASWWLDGMPPIDGRLRFIFYFGLLVYALAHSKSPLLAIRFYAAVDPQLLQTEGLLAWLGISYQPLSIVTAIHRVTLVAWVCAGLGLFTRTSTLATAIGFAILHGMFLRCVGSNHSWYLPMYGMFLMCFARTADYWSVDYHLFGKRLVRSPAILGDTGFARQALLIFAVGFYFAAGFSKLATAGLAWMDGESLRYFIGDKDGAIPRVLSTFPESYSLLSVGTIIVEH